MTNMSEKQIEYKTCCIICGLKKTKNYGWCQRVMQGLTIHFCGWEHEKEWVDRTQIGHFDILGKTLIKELTVRVFRSDGGVDVSDPSCTPVIEVTIDLLTFDKAFAKGCTRKNHSFFWGGKIPDKFDPLNKTEMEDKIRELIRKVTSHG